MDIRRLCKGAVAAARIRDQLQKTGMTFAGQPLWTDEEVATLIDLYPRYKDIAQVLGRRTFGAVRAKARSLGLAAKLHRWTDTDKNRFRKMYRTGGVSKSVRDAFPQVTKGNLKWIAHYYRFRRDPRPPKLSGFPLIDEIRHRAFELGYTMIDLDLMAGTGYFYRRGRWTADSENHRNIGRAVKALGGHFYAEWPEPEVGSSGRFA